jgi:hypothetical protein
MTENSGDRIQETGVAGSRCRTLESKKLGRDRGLGNSKLFALVEDFERLAHAGFVHEILIR